MRPGPRDAKGRLDGEKAALRAEADAELVKARMASAAISELARVET